MRVGMYTVGPVQENCFLVAADAGDRAVLIDPGEEADRLLAEIAKADVTLDAILLTHTHFDHLGAVGPVARATGAPVYCPTLEQHVLANVMDYVPYAGFGPFESYDADHLVGGGESLQLAGLDIDVVFTPGHSPGHVTYVVREAGADPATPPALFSGDVLFQSSVGRTDLPGGDHATLLDSIRLLLDAYPDDSVVHPGHMGLTTLGTERATNPFLTSLAQ
ncbi:MAG: beta-lactamase domain protein [Solirubrobacterales bacterium]|jgi:glyoxylase-like metal-dependent hydrolase (beta-lactamase superfamily II)|nr:beta-lactamase domain protein [Solirubrobacterales bacterium]